MAQTNTSDTFIQTLKNHKTKLAILGLVALLFTAFNYSNSGSAFNFNSTSENSLDNLPEPAPNMRWGFAIDTFEVVENTIQQNQFFGEILQENKVPYPKIQKILEETKDFFNVNN